MDISSNGEERGTERTEREAQGVCWWGASIFGMIAGGDWRPSPLPNTFFLPYIKTDAGPNPCHTRAVWSWHHWHHLAISLSRVVCWCLKSTIGLSPTIPQSGRLAVQLHESLRWVGHSVATGKGLAHLREIQMCLWHTVNLPLFLAGSTSCICSVALSTKQNSMQSTTWWKAQLGVKHNSV